MSKQLYTFRDLTQVRCCPFMRSLPRELAARNYWRLLRNIKGVGVLHLSLETEICQMARDLGFELCGITTAENFPSLKRLLAARAKKGLRVEFEPGDATTRTEPTNWLAEARSIIIVGYCYESIPPKRKRGFVQVARFARQEDYHRVLTQKLTDLYRWLEQRTYHAVRGVIAVDSKPPVERALAKRAGIGWWGKNCCLVNKDFGSFFVLGELVVDLELAPTSSNQRQACGSCRRCIAACPTGAIEKPHRLNFKKCLSYWTQARGFIPREIRPLLGARIYGCDTCQEVCPYNERNQKSGEEWTDPTIKEILTMTSGEFKRRWRFTAAGWRGKKNLQRNALVAAGNSRNPKLLPCITSFLRSQFPELRGHAAWALGEIGDSASKKPLEEGLKVEKDSQVIEEIQAAISKLML